MDKQGFAFSIWRKKAFICCAILGLHVTGSASWSQTWLYVVEDGYHAAQACTFGDAAAISSEAEPKGCVGLECSLDDALPFWSVYAPGVVGQSPASGTVLLRVDDLPTYVMAFGASSDPKMPFVYLDYDQLQDMELVEALSAGQRVRVEIWLGRSRVDVFEVSLAGSRNAIEAFLGACDGF